ncbi:cupin domain-containing protein [Hyphomicrobium sp.]|uniref:cupin domain-containing protein n=1 Tax=Hyphomicrobium sp. TaxID=82 RepID=UPI000FB20030|nr:cupin domain-containing protein [Hyphomicrobium sp.]RUP00363.1 MAG: DUF4437 domain-containing protein [Hyphomicrobium sp.]
MTTNEFEELVAGLVLGGLSQDERRHAGAIEQREADLHHAVDAIAMRLSPLATLISPAEPPPDLFAGIETRIAEADAALTGTLTLRADAYDWRPLSDGVETALLWRNEKANRQSSLIRMKPGARYQSHDHDDDEECLVIQGDLKFGDLLLKAGDFHFAPKGRTHPSAFSPSGCLLYITAGIT